MTAPFPQDWDLCRRGGRKNQKWWMTSRHRSVGAHMPLQGLCQHTQNLHKIMAQWKNNGHEATQN